MALPEIVKDIEARVKDTGDTMTGLLKAHGGISLNASTEQSTGPLYLLGIKAFAEGGNVVWSNINDVNVGFAKNATNDAGGSRIDLTYLKLAGGTMTGPIKNGTLTNTWVSACNGNAFINSTRGAGAFSPMLSGATSNGRMTLAFYNDALQIAYITKANCDINNNNVAKVAKLFTESGGAEWPGLLVQGSPSTDTSIAKMNRFQADLYVAGNGAAPNKPSVPGFYLGRSETDENRHMDIVSGGDFAYIDFNKASVVEDFKFRILVDVKDGPVNFQWSNATNPQLNIQGGLAVAGATSISGALTAGGNIYINNGGHGGIGLYNTSSPNTYGIHMSLTSSYGTHGPVTGDWATYFCFNGANDRGWIFKHAGTNVASISGTGGAKFDNTVFGYAYTRSNNKAAFMWDKPGANYTGVGANGTSDTIQFGACDINGSWVTSYQQIWKFNGALTLETGDGINNASKNYISAGRGYSTGSGKNGLKLICTEQTDAISGIGQDCTGKAYELSVGAALSTAGAGYITFVGHKMASLNSYAELGHFNFANSTFYVNGKIGVGHASPSYSLQVEGTSFTRGLLTCNRGTANSYGDAALEIREYNFGGAQSDTWGIAPRLSFHWGGVVAAQIGLASNGWLYAMPNAHNGGGMAKIVLENGGQWGITARHSKNTGHASFATTSSTTYLLVRIKSDQAYWMSAFTLRVYQGYNHYDVTFSGYQYGTNYWYSPQATLSSSTITSVNCYFGYVSANEMWVAIPGGNYTGAKVINVVNGYQQFTDIANAFTIENVSSLPGTHQATVTAYRPWLRNERVSESTTCEYPAGFSSRTTGATWGNTTGTSITSWNDSTGGSVDWRRDNPSSGKISMKVDGRVYVNEGNNPVLSSEHTNSYWGICTPDGSASEWIRTTTLGLIPYQSGGHGSLGTSSWPFSTIYANNFYGYLNGTSTAATYLPNNTTMSYGWNGLQYFNASMSASSTAGANNSPTADWYHIIRMNHANANGYYFDIASCFHNNNMYFKRVASGTSSGWKHIWVEGNSVTSAVWNDYAECREADTIESGYVLVETGDDTLTKSTERLSPFAGVSSDTWGFSQGETDRAKTPIAVAGRVLVYPYQDRNNYKPGDCVCAAPGGKVDIMTREEVIQYPDRIVGTVSSVPTYDKWGGGEGADRDPVNVNGRIWIKVK